MPNTTLTKLRDRLAQAIFDDREKSELSEPLPFSEWVAMSALQKAVRRNESLPATPDSPHNCCCAFKCHSLTHHTKIFENTATERPSDF